MTDIKWAEEKGDAVAKEWLESVRNPLGLGIRIKRALLEAERRGYEKAVNDSAEVAENYLKTNKQYAGISNEIRKLKGEQC